MCLWTGCETKTGPPRAVYGQEGGARSSDKGSDAAVRRRGQDGGARGHARRGPEPAAEAAPLVVVDDGAEFSVAERVALEQRVREAAEEASPGGEEAVYLGRAGRCTRLHEISTSLPRRRRDSSPRNVDVATAASPRRVKGRST